jgi:hypothetical protein
MTGDLVDIVLRLRSLLPKRWFAEKSPNLDALLTSIASPWVWLYVLIDYAIQQTRLATASDEWLDLIAADYFGQGLRRKIFEADISYRGRIRAALLREAATRSAIIRGLRGLTGVDPVIFEPANCTDTGGYGTLSGAAAVSGGGLSYGRAGGWGNLDLPYQFFVTVARPLVPGVAMLAGYGTPGGGYGQGSLGYVAISLLPGQVTDAEIQNTLNGLLPINAVAWLRII